VGDWGGEAGDAAADRVAEKIGAVLSISDKSISEGARDAAERVEKRAMRSTTPHVEI
jgi:hypothetical protein